MLGRLTVLAVMMTGTALGQTPGAKDPFKDVSMLQPPRGSKVAIVVFEDLGCPGCALWHPYEQAAAEREHVPLVRHDFPIKSHVWTFQGAVNARYIEDTLHNPQLAEQYRSDLFKAQRQIAGKDDLQRYTINWLQQHGQKPPFVMDPTGTLARKVQADYDLGTRMNLEGTPTVVVVTREHYQVLTGVGDKLGDPNLLVAAIEAALAQTKASPAKAAAAKHR